ncbi:MAG: HAMP domain-containing sensor histidine kinase [Clostridium sp.]
MYILRNNEVKRIIGTCFITLILSCIGLCFLLNNGFNEASKRYVEQNISLVGAIVNENPELEDVIVPIITKGKLQENYELGLSILSKYSYNKDISTSKNHITNGLYSDFTGYLLIGWIILFILLTIVILREVKPIYENLAYLGKLADDMVEGMFHREKLDLKEGELAIFYNKFSEMGGRLEYSVESLKQERVNLKDIINDISHQLKTPLASLITYNDILKNHEKMKVTDVDRFIELSSKQLDRMQWLIVTLLKYARLESNVVKYNKEKIYLKDTINKSIVPLITLAEEKNQNIIFHSKSNVIFNHDERWIGEAISNIVKNAIEHSDKDQDIELRLEETALSIIISIRDNGCGIDKKELKNIFKRFYKGEVSLNPVSIGIGLALSKKIIEDHGGDINVNSELGKGTVFNIIFLKTVV